MAGIEKQGQPENRWQFNGQEKELALNLGWLDYKYRKNYDLQISRFHSVDPIAEDYVYLTPFQHASNNPASKIEIEGLEGTWSVLGDAYDWAKKNLYWTPQQYYSKSTPGEKVHALSNVDATITLKNPSNGAIPVATKIAENSGLDDKSGGKSNALRHVVGQALATQQVGEETAKEFGDAHDPNVTQQELVYQNSKPEPDEDVFDSYVDSYNNKVGRDLGKNNSNLSPQKLALKALDMLNNGALLVTKKNSEGKILILKSRLSPEEYKSAKKNISNLSNSGRTKEDQQKVDTNNKKMIKARTSFATGGYRYR